MNDIININYGENGDRPTVMGRDLHKALELKTEYVKWFERMCEYGFTEDLDYSTFLTNRSDGKAGKPKTDHQLTIEMAKEICMIQRTDKGKQCRQYFIEIEKRFKESKPDFESLSPQLQFMIRMEQRQNALEKRMDSLENDRDKTIKATLDYSRIDSRLISEINRLVKVKAIELCEFAETYDKVGKTVITNIYNAMHEKFNVASHIDITYAQFSDVVLFIKCFEPNNALNMIISKSFPKASLAFINKLFED